jgi:K(+)-stimulated pyrophosphate-energized sodium pump
VRSAYHLDFRHARPDDRDLSGLLLHHLFISNVLFSGKKDFDFEAPLTHLVWVTSAVSILATFGASYLLLSDLQVKDPTLIESGYASVAGSLWWVLSVIISCGTVAGALIPEFTKVFTSTNSRHVQEVVNASRQGGASLNILSGLVAGNFSAFWKGGCIMVLMLISYLVRLNPALRACCLRSLPSRLRFSPSVWWPFGFLSMGPVTIAVDSYGPVTDNAQSVYELSQVDAIPTLKEDIKRDFGFSPDTDTAKYLLEKGDGAGNTFKATAKPVLIGTAVVGATTMIFGIIMLLMNTFGKDVVLAKLSLVAPPILFGLLAGGAVIYWFTGASIQAVVTGAYQAVVYIKNNIKLDAAKASVKDSKEVVKICTQYAQRGMWNIFIVIFCMALALPFFDPFFFIGLPDLHRFLRSVQAIFMANAGGAWDNAKKIVKSTSARRIPISMPLRWWAIRWAILSKTPPRFP